jgi:hypothetical protein
VQSYVRKGAHVTTFDVYYVRDRDDELGPNVEFLHLFESLEDAAADCLKDNEFARRAHEARQEKARVIHDTIKAENEALAQAGLRRRGHYEEGQWVDGAAWAEFQPRPYQELYVVDSIQVFRASRS